MSGMGTGLAPPKLSPATLGWHLESCRDLGGLSSWRWHPGLDAVLFPGGVIETPGANGDKVTVGGEAPGAGCPAGMWLVVPAPRLIP